jgi:RNA polymerase sigma-70 factor (ECF subfamily)
MIANVADLHTEISFSPLVTSRGKATESASDAELVKRLAEGDKIAIQALYSRHSVRVFRFALRILSSETAAEDVVNEVFLDVWRKAEQFEGRSQVSTWLLAIARNKAVESRRRFSTDVLDEQTATSIEDPADNPEMVAHKKEISSILRECLTLLSPVHRQVIDLVYYHETSIGDAAEILGIAQNTVKTRMFYARRHLIALLATRGITVVH